MNIAAQTRPQGERSVNDVITRYHNGLESTAIQFTPWQNLGGGHSSKEMSMMFLCPSSPSSAVIFQSCVYANLQTSIERGRESRDLPINVSKSEGQLLCRS